MLSNKISQNKTKLWYGALTVSPLKEEEDTVLPGYKLLLEWKTNYLDETAGPMKCVSVTPVTVVTWDHALLVFILALLTYEALTGFRSM